MTACKTPFSHKLHVDYKASNATTAGVDRLHARRGWSGVVFSVDSLLKHEVVVEIIVVGNVVEFDTIQVTSARIEEGVKSQLAGSDVYLCVINLYRENPPLLTEVSQTVDVLWLVVHVLVEVLFGDVCVAEVVCQNASDRRFHGTGEIKVADWGFYGGFDRNFECGIHEEIGGGIGNELVGHHALPTVIWISPCKGHDPAGSSETTTLPRVAD